MAFLVIATAGAAGATSPASEEFVFPSKRAGVTPSFFEYGPTMKDRIFSIVTND